VTIRGKLNGTNTGTSAPLTAPIFLAILWPHRFEKPVRGAGMGHDRFISTNRNRLVGQVIVSSAAAGDCEDSVQRPEVTES
jgi:hypothetical protein